MTMKTVANILIFAMFFIVGLAWWSGAIKPGIRRCLCFLGYQRVRKNQIVVDIKVIESFGELSERQAKQIGELTTILYQYGFLKKKTFKKDGSEWVDETFGKLKDSTKH